jgi:two-component system sensor histidine kinase KdpD
LDDRPAAGVRAAIAVLALLATTLLVAVLEGPLGVPDASAAYLLAVVSVAVAAGTRAAIGTAIGAFLAYDILFIEPRLTITVSDPGEWLNLLLLLLVGIVVGQLAGLQRNRADAAEAREREARAVFGVSHALATAPSLEEAAASIVAILAADARMERAWIRLGDDGAAVSTLADSRPGAPLPPTANAAVLRRMPGAEPAVWTRVHEPGRTGASLPDLLAHRVRIADGERAIGSVWCLRRRELPPPDRSETRLLSAAADQLAGALVRRRLAAAATDAEITRRSEAAKTALLDSVSHDLRTPLASIRTAAGALMDPDVTWSAEEMRHTAGAIDREADRLNRLVSNLLDMSRIDAGVLQPQVAPYVLADLLERTAERMVPLLQPRTLELAVPADLEPVRVDEVWIDQVLTNLLENAARYTPADATVRITARAEEGGVRLTIADDGPGVPATALPRLFEKFYRVPRPREGSRRGSGIGLSVVRGLVDAMGGRIEARAVEPHGLAVDLWLPVAGLAAPDVAGTAQAPAPVPVPAILDEAPEVADAL